MSAIDFKTLPIQQYFSGVLAHPEVRTAAEEFGVWSARKNLPRPLVSDLQRTKAELTAIYLSRYQSLRARATVGNLSGLSGDDRELALKLRGKSDSALQAEAEARQSWHLYGCAIDFSGNRYATEADFKLARTFFERFRLPDWECITHTVAGARPHFHIARRDWTWRKNFNSKSKPLAVA